MAAGPVQAQPVVELLTRYAVPADETAASAPEGEAPQGSGKKLAELEADLALVSEGLEAFAHPQDAAKALLAAKPRLPAGTAPFFRDRATALDSLYRTLAVVDYTWALRFPNPPCSPAEKRAELLRSDDGLFVDRVSGNTSAWMTTLLGPIAEGKDLEAALDRASASATPSQAEYARLRARQNLITKALGSDGAVGEARAGLYCKRAETRVRLAAANRASKQVLAARSSEAKAPRQGVVIVAGKTSEGLEARGAGVVVNTKLGIRILTDRRLGDGKVVALIDGKNAPVALTIEREDAPSGLLLLRPEGGVGEALTLAGTAPEKGDLVFAYAHSERLGAWTRTQGLVTSAGSNQFQTDAIVDASMTGGAVLDEEGRLAGLLVLRSAATGEWPAGVPAPALYSWIEGGRAPDAEPGFSLDAGTTKVLTASRPLLDSLSVGQGAIAAARAEDIYTQTPWGTVRGVCMANCEDSAPATSYSGGSNGNRELGEALGKLAAVGLEALIFKGIPALFRGIGSLFKSRPSLPAPSIPPATIRDVAQAEKPPEPPKKITCTFAKINAPSRVGVDAVELKVRFHCDDAGSGIKVPLAGHKVTFTLGWNSDKKTEKKGKDQYDKIERETDAHGYASLAFSINNPETNAERSFVGLDSYDPDKRRTTAPRDYPGAAINAASPNQVKNASEAAAVGGMLPEVVQLLGKEKSVRSTVSISLKGGSVAAGGTLGEIAVTGVAAGTILVLGGTVVIFTVNYGLNEMIAAQDKYNEAIDTRKPFQSAIPRVDAFNELDRESQNKREDDCFEARRRNDVLSQFIDESRLGSEFLNRHEGVDGGHTLVKHVKNRYDPLDLEFLRRTLSKYNKASAFDGQAVAEAAIREAVTSNIGIISDWLFGQKVRVLPIYKTGEAGKAIGFGIARDNLTPVDRYNTNVRLVRQPECKIAINSAWPE